MSPERDKSQDISQEAKRVLGLIDLTSLGDDDTEEMIAALCANAETSHGPVAAVCVWPRFVGKAAKLLSGTPIGIAAVANFPKGDPDPSGARNDAMEIVAAGGTEVDVVYPWRALVSGDELIGKELVEATRAVIGPNITLKVILETGELIDADLIRAAASGAISAGADFLKTSTGKTERSATLDAAATLLEVISSTDRQVGIKISGGVRTVEQAVAYLALADEVMGQDWVSSDTFRFGASGLLGDVLRLGDDAEDGY